MLEVFDVLRANETTIKSEHDHGVYTTVSSIASQFGYNHENTEYGVIFFGRRVPYNDALMRRVFRDLELEGYAVEDSYKFLKGVNIRWKVIGSKHYDAGRTAVMERWNIDQRYLIMLVGRVDEKTIIGVPLDPKPEHVSIVQNVTEHLNMQPIYSSEPIHREKKPDQEEIKAFEKLLGDTKINL